MPTYEYACTSCGQHLEVVQSMSDAPLRECGACGGALRKVFSPIGIVFKGSGFYRTDSRAASAKKNIAAKQDGEKPAAAKDKAGGGASSTSAESA
jgi:putative FmdB family regulatory protein